MKRGLSPLISSVLLIAFVVTLFLVISSFFSSTTEEAMSASGDKLSGSLECDDAKVEVTNVNLLNGDIELNVVNEGKVNVDGYVVRFVGDLDSDFQEVPSSISHLGGSKDVVSVTAGKTLGAVKEIEIYPMLEGGRCSRPSSHKIKGDDYTHFLDTSLVAAYDFNNNFLDVSRNGNNGINNGADCSVGGKKSGGCSFDGVDDVLEIGNYVLSSFSIEAWVNKLGGGDKGRIVGGGGYPPSVQMRVKNNKLSGFLYSDGNCPSHQLTAEAISSDDLLDNTWHHVVFTSELGEELKVFIDGDEKGSAGYSCTISPTVPLSIGESFTGLIDSVAMYNRVLVEDEIKEHAKL